MAEEKHNSRDIIVLDSKNDKSGGENGDENKNNEKGPSEDKLPTGDEKKEPKDL